MLYLLVLSSFLTIALFSVSTKCSYSLCSVAFTGSGDLQIPWGAVLVPRTESWLAWAATWALCKQAAAFLAAPGRCFHWAGSAGFEKSICLMVALPWSCLTALSSSWFEPCPSLGRSRCCAREWRKHRLVSLRGCSGNPWLGWAIRSCGHY